MNPALTEFLEITSLHLQLLQDSRKFLNKSSDFTFLYFFKDNFKDMFSFLEHQLNIHYSHGIVFPELCQEFLGCLNKLCPEEYEVKHNNFPLLF